ncbi:MAG: ribosomal protein S18-alanine N-acetyltransferase [Oscillospiraceae bacterium]|nr:ribosomal protein S18-alanine N-acetyltransferase [Oscillospiraceae bacterium]
MAPCVTDAAERHLEAVERLEQRCFSLPWTREQLLHALPDENHVFLVAEDSENGELLGYVSMTHVLDEGYISNVAVDPACRREGVGSALIEELLRRAGELELSFVTLEVRESNAPAVGLYERFGFRPVGRRKNYYEAPREDALLMTVFLKGSDPF